MSRIQGANGIRASAGFSASVVLLVGLTALHYYVEAQKNWFAMLNFFCGATNVEDIVECVFRARQFGGSSMFLSSGH